MHVAQNVHDIRSPGTFRRARLNTGTCHFSTHLTAGAGSQNDLVDDREKAYVYAVDADAFEDEDADVPDEIVAVGAGANHEVMVVRCTEMMAQSDGVVILSCRARDLLGRRAAVMVIPTLLGASLAKSRG